MAVLEKLLTYFTQSRAISAIFLWNDSKRYFLLESALIYCIWRMPSFLSVLSQSMLQRKSYIC